MENGRMRGQIAGNLISLLVGIILIVAVLIPVTKDTTSNLALTGTAKTITDLLVPMLALLALILVVGGMRN